MPLQAGIKTVMANIAPKNPSGIPYASYICQDVAPENADCKCFGNAVPLETAVKWGRALVAQVAWPAACDTLPCMA